MRILVVGDAGDNDWGFVGERLLERGAELVELDRDHLPKWSSAQATPADLVLLLGSVRSVSDATHAASVRTESALIGDAVEACVPVLGICYGAQIAAHALGGRGRAAAHGEVGFFIHDSDDDALCPPGPWVQFHADSFDPPPDATVLGRSSAGPQGFSLERGAARVLAWQFHPEATPDELGRWLDDNLEYARSHGADPESVRELARVRVDDSRRAAHALTDAALTWLVEQR